MKKPLVSVIVATFNEEKYIVTLLKSLCAQTFKESFEILIVDGNSIDKTKEKVKDFAKKNKQKNVSIHVFDNPKRRAPFAFNIGVKKSRADFFCLVGAHSKLARNWIEESYTSLLHQPKDVMAVGGLWKNESHNTPFTNAICFATGTFWGGGISTYRYAKEAQYVDTVVYGLYRKEVIKKVGLFDTNFLHGQDGEYNLQIRKKGFRLFFNPKIVSWYKVRPNAKAFAKQMYFYGQSRTHMLCKHKELNVKQMFPAGLVLYLAALPFLLLFWSLWWLIPLLIHSLGTILYSLRTPRFFFHLLAVYSIIHYCFGFGMVVAFFKRLAGNKVSG